MMIVKIILFIVGIFLLIKTIREDNLENAYDYLSMMFLIFIIVFLIKVI